MKNINKIQLSCAMALLSAISITGHISARENLVTSTHRNGLKTTGTGCLPAAAAIDLDINNVQARLMTGGDMWWNIGEQVAAYVIPANSGKSSQFAASCWIGGFDQQGQLKVAGQTYRQDGNDFWPGALDATGKISLGACNNWDFFWKVDKSDINAFIALYQTSGSSAMKSYKSIMQWPGAGSIYAVGNTGPLGLDQPPYSSNSYAPFVDLNGNGIYEPDKGEYPDITGDEYIFWVFNDAGSVKEQSGTAAIGVEIQTCGFAYATQDFLNNSTFYNYRVINRGALTIDSTYIAVWDDCDLGWYYDDFIGCDTSRGLGIQYNGTNDDGRAGGHPPNSYGPYPPQVGVDYFKGPLRIVHRKPPLADTFQQLQMTNFTYFNNDASAIGNPDNGVQMYYYMTGSIKTGQRFSDDFQGGGKPSKGYGSGPVSNFVFWGDPGDNSQWSECACNNNPGDRRFIFSSGPFVLIPGAVNNITFGCIWAPQPVGGCPYTSFATIRNIDDQAQALFDNDFKTVEGPEAPRLSCVELDRKLVFYIVNDPVSNNYGENYGRNDGSYVDSVRYHQRAIKSIGSRNPKDSLYKFEGYRVFQLANGLTSSAGIINQTTGEVDPTQAAEVFECDIHNGITQIVNYAKNVNVSDTTYFPEILVSGKDSGIVHSFELTQDQFSTTSDKQFVNYQTYYFVAIAYAYNNFEPFNADSNLTTQDQPYLGSAHGAGGINIPVVAAMPNPANGAMGTILNADYGTGIVITRIEGQGNGGLNVEIDSASEDAILTNNYIDSAVYVAGRAPINVKVINPEKDSAYNWVLQIVGPMSTTSHSSWGITDTASWKLTAFDSKGQVHGDVIYSEENISTVNEQILEQYGLSVTISQVVPPGVDQAAGNGYITSSITFDNVSLPWLAGVQTVADSNGANWLRSGNVNTYNAHGTNDSCNMNDYTKLDTNLNYASMLSNFTPTKASWGPYVLAAGFNGKHSGIGSPCGFDVAYSSVNQDSAHFVVLPDVDLVFTPDKSKWTRCAVIEEQENPALAQGGALKFGLRNHAGWDLDIASDGNTPMYSEVVGDRGMSWFPGYAINEGTGERLNIVFGEDSYLGSDNGADMLWNPTSTEFSPYDGSIIFGGKHIVYVLGTRYDSDQAFAALVSPTSSANPNSINMNTAYSVFQWVGIPLSSPNIALTSLSNGLIPTKTRLSFRVDRPYKPYTAVDTANLYGVTAGQASNPYYSFSTYGLAPTQLSDTSNRNALLNLIGVVPNPYFGYSGYETSRFDTKVRIINLPQQATIYIYSLDGALVRTLTKDDGNSYVDWDIKNSAGLPVASGMYLMDVKAVGIGEVVLKWFGAERPIDVTTY